jgi:hypothetical protein
MNRIGLPVNSCLCMKLTPHVSSVEAKNAWSYTSDSACTFVTCCEMQHRDNFLPLILCLGMTCYREQMDRTFYRVWQSSMYIAWIVTESTQITGCEKGQLSLIPNRAMCYKLPGLGDLSGVEIFWGVMLWLPENICWRFGRLYCIYLQYQACSWSMIDVFSKPRWLVFGRHGVTSHKDAVFVTKWHKTSEVF